MRVAVTNNGASWSGRFDGEEFEFPAGEQVTIPERAAMFFFAFGLTDADRARVLVRNGWQKMGAGEFGPEAARKRLMSFSFKTAPDVERKRPAPRELAPARVTDTERERVALKLPGGKGPLAA